jgi:hypothetical protein
MLNLGFYKCISFAPRPSYPLEKVRDSEEYEAAWKLQAACTLLRRDQLLDAAGN